MENIMTVVYTVFVFLVSLCFGSFLNVVIYRLPNKMNLATPPSHCTSCNHELKWYDNIPIISYLMLKGKCRYCGAKISPRYLIVEVSVAIISTLIFLKFGLSFISLFGILFFMLLVAISFIDIEHWIIPDSLVIGLIIIGIASMFLGERVIEFKGEIIKVDYISRLIGAGGVAVFFLIVLLIEKLIKREIFGGGDIKLMFGAVLILGWQLLCLGFIISCVMSCLIQIPILIYKENKRRSEEKEKAEKELLKTLINVEEKPLSDEEGKEVVKEDNIEDTEEKSEDRNNSSEEDEVEEKGKKGYFPFGPYLAIGFMIAFVFGVDILSWYLGVLII